ncbi:hypothetical protein CR513_29812, partial [Mucuna pruriens]
MTRSSTDPLYAFDPKIEKTLRRLRRTRNLIVNNSRSSDSTIKSNQFCTDNFVASSNIFAEPGQMENNDKTLKELATPDVSCRRRPTQAFEGIPCGLLHNEVTRDTEDYIKMKAFPFSLDGAVKDWLYLRPALFNTWGDMRRTFLEKFFLESRIASIRKEICGIRQHTRETLHEYWERFNKLCATCPHHQISEQLLIQYFYEGLLMMEKSMIDAASGGTLIDETPTVARHLISNMARPSQSRMVNEIGAASNQRLENQLTELTSLVRQLVVGQHQPVMAATVCGICTSVEHPTDMCPTLQKTESDQPECVGAIGGPQYGKQPYQTQQLGPYAAPRGGFVLNMPYGITIESSQYLAQAFPQQQQRSPTQGNSPSLEDLMKQLATSNLEFQQLVSSSNMQF